MNQSNQPNQPNQPIQPKPPIQPVQAQLAIVGCRNYSNYEQFNTIINDRIIKMNIKPTTIVSGGASGVDTMAERYAKDNKLSLIVHEAIWRKNGVFDRTAGSKRNQLIINDSSHCIALVSKDSVGTLITIKMARTKKIPTEVINI